MRSQQISCSKRVAAFDSHQNTVCLLQDTGVGCELNFSGLELGMTAVQIGQVVPVGFDDVLHLAAT